MTKHADRQTNDLLRNTIVQKIKAASIGELLYKYSDSKLPEELKPKGYTEYEISLIRSEIMFLDIFVADYWVNLEFDNNNAVKDAILKAYYSYWEKMANDTEMPEFLSDMYIRFSAYSLALRTPHHLTPMFVLGNKFAEFCGFEEELAINIIGASVFHVNSEAIADMLKNIKKEYEIIL